MNLSVTTIETELKIFESKFKESVRSNAPMLDRIMRYIVNRKGKQLRPMFVFLSAKLGGEINESSYRTASLVEILHTATLVHDDVVDDSMERRGYFSTYALWKNKISVLVGDYLLAKGLLLSLDNDDFRILKILSEAVRKMSEGELLQIEKARTLKITEEIYYEIIRNKTASLLASACSAGIWSTSANDELTEKMRKFGENVGMAFQIKDDLFDYFNNNTGKPSGNDIKEKKITLPLIYTLNTVDKSMARKIIYIVKNQNKNADKVKLVTDIVKQSGGIDYAVKRMNDFKTEAMNILKEFSETQVRRELEALVHFVTDRNF